jgi:hypothetical protein
MKLRMNPDRSSQEIYNQESFDDRQNLIFYFHHQVGDHRKERDS